MEMNSIVQFIENKTILVTGATGFLAKIFVEKILRVQPNVKKLYLLVRAADSKSALQRFNSEVIGKDVFKVLKQKYGATNFQTFMSEKITPVAGDITFKNLGVNDTELLEEMWKQLDVVVNVAATTKFDERYDIALNLNTFGIEHVSNFVKKCVNIKLLLHVSTAYVSGETPGLILETPLKYGEALNGKKGLDINAEKELAEEKLIELKAENATDKEITIAMKELGIQRAKLYGWPNTYVFTKAMGEMLIGELRGDLPLVILRPTIITSTYKEPLPGWVEGVRTIDSLSVGYGKGRLTCFLGDLESVLDMIPADMVVNAMIAAMVAHANEPSETIYQVGSSVSNPLKCSYIQDYNFEYFTKHPLMDKDGNPIRVGDVTVLSSMDSFYRYMAVRYVLPLKGLRVANKALCHVFNGTYHNLDRKISTVMRLADLYKPYCFSKCFYDDANLEKLRKATRESDGVEAEMFFFNPKIINWEDYYMNTHLHGLVKYAVK